MTSTPVVAGPVTGSDDQPADDPVDQPADQPADDPVDQPVRAGAGPGSDLGPVAAAATSPANRRSAGEGGKWSGRTVSVLLYSDDPDTRAAVRLAVGPRPAADLPRLRWLECATGAAVISAVDQGGLDLLILDGEAVPSGGMGLCKQLKDEIYQCPPILVLTGRPQDAWLATWSRADFAVPHPLDPVAVADAVASLLRHRLG